MALKIDEFEEDSESFSVVIEFNETAQTILQRSARTIQKLKEIDSPCSCANYMCEHWMELATFIIAREEYYGRR